MSLEIENGLIYCCINSGEAYLETASKINSTHFHSSAAQNIWVVLQKLSEDGLPFDEPIIKSKLEDRTKLAYDEIKWQSVNTDNYQHYIDGVLNGHHLRKLENLGPQISSAVQEGKGFEDILNLAAQKILEVSDETVGTEIAPIGSLLDSFVQKIKDGRKKGITTTLEKLDELTNGFLPGQLIVVAGRPSMGKSAFAMQVAYVNTLIHEIPFAIFSLEMPQEEMLERIISNIANIESWKIRNGKLSDIDWKKLRKFIADFKKAPFYMEDVNSATIASIRAKAKRLKMKHPDLGGIVVDYIQLMDSGNSDGNRVQAVSDISRGLKILAKELKIPVIAVSQLNRGVEQRENKRPLLSDLRESGAIEQDADVVIMLYRDDYYTDENNEESLLDLGLAKQRNGPLGTVKSIFKKNFQRISGISAV